MDQCGRCTVKGDYGVCSVTPCGKHEDWIVIRLTSELAAAKEEIAQLTAENGRLILSNSELTIAAVAAESSLASERKETERLRKSLRRIGQVEPRFLNQQEMFDEARDALKEGE